MAGVISLRTIVVHSHSTSYSHLPAVRIKPSSLPATCQSIWPGHRPSRIASVAIRSLKTASKPKPSPRAQKQHAASKTSHTLPPHVRSPPSPSAEQTSPLEPAPPSTQQISASERAPRVKDAWELRMEDGEVLRAKDVEELRLKIREKPRTTDAEVLCLLANKSTVAREESPIDPQTAPHKPAVSKVFLRFAIRACAGTLAPENVIQQTSPFPVSGRTEYQPSPGETAVTSARMRTIGSTWCSCTMQVLFIEKAIELNHPLPSVKLFCAWQSATILAGCGWRLGKRWPRLFDALWVPLNLVMIGLDRRMVRCSAQEAPGRWRPAGVDEIVRQMNRRRNRRAPLKIAVGLVGLIWIGDKLSRDIAEQEEKKSNVLLPVHT